MKKFCLLLAMLLLPGLCGCGADAAVPELREPMAVTWQTAEACRGDIFRLDAYDAIVTTEMEEAAFADGGVLKELYVRPGDRVAAGQLLAQLETEQLEENLYTVQKSAYQYEVSFQFSLSQTECDLAIARLRLEEITGGKTVAVLKAEKTAKDAEVTALQAEIAALETQIAGLQETVAALEAAGETSPEPVPSPESSPAPAAETDEAALQEARDALSTAEEQLAAKKTALETAQKAATDLQEKITSAEAAQLQIQQLENSISYLYDDYYLQMAEYGESMDAIQAQIDACSLYAEHDGVVRTVTANQPGVYVRGILVYIAIDGTEYLQAADSSIAQTTAYVEANVGGEIYEMALIAYSSAEYSALSRNGVKPPARFSFPEGTRGITAGQYAQLLVYDGIREDVLLVPINTVYFGSSDAESFVYRIVDGEKVYTPVVTGTRNDVCVEIREGLTEGDVVYVRD